ncbi:MAG: twin-arginine translocase subunit TatB [Cardiobacteriaceae bacterium]|nr:twin-arginine translocase subunit TatB [Cardiobacteriaceae bacterium]
MFDIGFWELVTIAIIGVVVVGPDKLPEVMRGIFRFIHNLRRMYQNAKADISRELELDELQKIAREGKDDFQDAFDSVAEDGKELLRAIDENHQNIKKELHEI